MRPALILVCACHAPAPPPPAPPAKPVVATPPAPDAAVTSDAAPIAGDPLEVLPAVPPRARVETTVHDYSYVTNAAMPRAVAPAIYKPLGKDNVVRVGISVDGAWAPLLWANGGMAAGKVWKDGNGGRFEVELVLVDDSIARRDALSIGDIHVATTSADMVPLLVASGLDKDTLPRVIQQVAWSATGDGIVVRDGIGSVAELAGKTIVVTPHSPSHFMLLQLLHDAGLDESRVTLKLTVTSFEAAAAFVAEPSIDACVSWSPDIYKLSAPATGNHLMVSTQLANQLLADVLVTRADFAKKHPEIVEGLVRGVLDATTELAKDANRDKVGPMLDTAFKLDTGVGKTLLADVHWTTYGDDRAFFDRADAASFARIYDDATQRYHLTGVPAADKIVDGSAIAKLGKVKAYAAQPRDATPAAASNGQVVLAKRVDLQFAPNSWDVHKLDKDADAKIDEVAAFVARFAHAHVEIAGHSDASMRGVVDAELVRELSRKRAEAVRDELVKRFKLDPARFDATGYGWDQPADPKDPDNHANNRRIEVRVFD